MPLHLGCIVEGHGDVAAVPILVRRIATDLAIPHKVQIPLPVRTSRSTLVKAKEIERAVEFTARKIGRPGGLLVLIDSDEDCPAVLGPQLLQRARDARSDLAIGVVLAKREFEAWFLAAAESLRGVRDLAADLTPPPDAEQVRDPKRWLRERMPRNQKYVETLHQPALAARFDLQTARRADSFDKCYREIARLLKELETTSGSGGV